MFLLGLAVGCGCLLIGFQRLGSKVGKDLAWGTVEKGPWLTIRAADSIHQNTMEFRVSHNGGYGNGGYGKAGV